MRVFERCRCGWTGRPDEDEVIENEVVVVGKLFSGAQ